MKYDVIIVGAGPGGIFSAYELMQKNEKLRVAVFELGEALKDRQCPIEKKKVFFSTVIQHGFSLLFCR